MYASAHLLRISKDARVWPRGGKQKLSLPVLQESCNFPPQLRRFYFIFPPTCTQAVILMAVQIHRNVVQEEEEVTGRHSV